ncbi:gfo/Idh/MocA family oxidoreductase, partial [Klebsiella pneumoniae]|uniref:Gfo/Idh/MocA family protein n=1 Tax=Klebsiella pneumoniae TaxID=573 RepID=UPI001027655B
KDIAANHHITNIFTTIDDMIVKTEVSAVVVSTPNKTHIPIAKKAVKHGIHVFIEKPIGTNLDEVRSYLEDAKKENIITMIGMTHRFRRDSTLLKEYMDNRTFGDVHYAKAKLYRQRGTP